MKRSTSTMRLRKVSCESCGYTVRMSRGWMLRGMPVCPCGQTMAPEADSDLAYCGLITEHDCKPTEWTAICRDNGWDDSIQRRGNAAKAFAKRELEAGGLRGRRAPAAHCAFPGCGQWVANGADRCSAGHAQHAQAPETEAIPF